MKPIQFTSNPEAVDALAQRFESALPKQTTTGLQVVARLLPQIEGFLAKGYSLTDVHAAFEDEGLECSYETFRRYFHKAKRSRDRQSSHQNPTLVIGTNAGLVAPTAVPLNSILNESEQSEASVIASDSFVQAESTHSVPLAVHSESSSQTKKSTKPQQIQETIITPSRSNEQIIPSQSARTSTATSSPKTKTTPTDVAVPDGQPPPVRLELEVQFPALATPRKSKAEKAKHFNQY